MNREKIRLIGVHPPFVVDHQPRPVEGMRQRTETLAEPQLRVRTALAEGEVADGRKSQEKDRPSDEPEHAGEQFRLFESEHRFLLG